jgi:hypothetical protein
LLLSFWIGRSSVAPRVIEAPTLPPEVAVTAPAIAPACPEPEPAPALECPPIEVMQVPVPVPVREAAPKPPRERSVQPGASNGLKNPFAKPNSTLHIGTNRGAEPAEIWIDGKRRGKTPLPNVKVPAGTHTIEFRFPDGKIIQRRIDIEDGGTEFIKMG